MATFTFYGSDVANGTISTACTATVNTGGAEASKASIYSGGNHFAEVLSQGAASGTPVTAIPATPTGKGWVTATPGAGTFATGNWSATLGISYAAVDTGNTLTIRFFRYSSGTYTSIGTIVAASATAARTQVSFTATSMGTITFAAGDLVYWDLWLTDTTGAGGDNPTIYESNSATAGVANDVQVTTSTFTPAGTVVNHDITFRGKISAIATHDITVRGKVSGIARKDVSFRGQVGNTVRKDIVLRGKVAGVVYKDITFFGKLSNGTHKLATFRGKIGNTVYKDIVVFGKVSGLAAHDATFRGKIGLFAFHFVNFRGPVSATSFRDATFRGKVAPVSQRDVRFRSKVSGTAFRGVAFRGQVIARNTAGGVGVWTNGTGIATFDSFRATQYPDPALSLAPVMPRLGTSLVQWNAIIPSAAATLGVDLSTDGVNWADVSADSGQQMPMFYPQPDPTIDGFASNTSANYTSTFRTGGSVATWTYDTANSRIVATGGTNAIYVNSSISRADVDFFADLDRSDAGGLVWRFVDASNFYYLLIGDTLASTGTPNTITLYRVVANVQTQLATATLSITAGPDTLLFWRGIYRRFRVAMLGSVITASMDGTNLITYNDATPLSTPGKVGLFNNGGTTGSRCNQLWIQPQGDYVTGTPPGDIVTGQFVYTRQRQATTDPTVTAQVVDMTTLAAGPNIRNGTQLPTITYNSAYIGKTYDDLSKLSNYANYVGVDPSGNMTLYFRQSTAVPSPWILQSNNLGLPSDLESDTNLVVETANNTIYRNRQTLTGVIGSAPYANSFVGDGTKTAFTLSYPVVSGFVPTITLNNIAQTVERKGTTGSQWYYAPGDAVLAQDASSTVLQSSDTLTAFFQAASTTKITVDNIPAQLALKAVQKGTGIVEEVEDVSSMQLDVPTALIYANSLLARNGLPGGRTATFKTYRQGLDILQTLTAFVPEENMMDVQLLILSITDYVQTTQINGIIGPLYGHVVVASELPYIASWPALLASNLLDG